MTFRNTCIVSVCFVSDSQSSMSRKFKKVRFVLGEDFWTWISLLLFLVTFIKQKHPQTGISILARIWESAYPISYGYTDSSKFKNPEQYNTKTKIHFQEVIYNTEILQGYWFTPVIEPEHEGAFITELQYASIKNGHTNKVPLMIGICSEEQIGWASGEFIRF